VTSFVSYFSPHCMHRVQKMRPIATDVMWFSCVSVGHNNVKFFYCKRSPYSITERIYIMDLIPVLGSQPAGDVSHKPDSRLPLLSARPAVSPATLMRVATSFDAW